MPRPVQAMKWELDGSSSRATRNCQSCSEPLRWYDGPSRYRPASCLMSPAGHVTDRVSTRLHAHTEQVSRCCFNRIRGGRLTFDLLRHHAGIIVEMPHHFVKHTTCEKPKNKGAFVRILSENPKCTITTFTRIIAGTFSPVSVSQIAVLP